MLFQNLCIKAEDLQSLVMGVRQSPVGYSALGITQCTPSKCGCCVFCLKLEEPSNQRILKNDLVFGSRVKVGTASKAQLLYCPSELVEEIDRWTSQRHLSDQEVGKVRMAKRAK